MEERVRGGKEEGALRLRAGAQPWSTLTALKPLIFLAAIQERELLELHLAKSKKEKKG